MQRPGAIPHPLPARVFCRGLQLQGDHCPHCTPGGTDASRRRSGTKKHHRHPPVLEIQPWDSNGPGTHPDRTYTGKPDKRPGKTQNRTLGRKGILHVPGRTLFPFGHREDR